MMSEIRQIYLSTALEIGFYISSVTTSQLLRDFASLSPFTVTLKRYAPEM